MAKPLKEFNAFRAMLKKNDVIHPAWRIG